VQLDRWTMCAISLQNPNLNGDDTATNRNLSLSSGGNKGAVRIPFLSFQYLRRPGRTAKLLCFHTAGGFAPHRLDHPMICSVSIYGKYSGAIRGNLRLDDHWSLAVGRESQQLPKGTHVEAWEAFVGARWSTGDDCEAVNPCNQLLHCLA
jgi:hypothetical protein